jgi:intracellular sulfur oxidation DsrE/DsrF family protein
MKNVWSCAVALVILVGSISVARAQSAQPLPVPGYEAAKDVPGSREHPDPALVYKIIFDIKDAAAGKDGVNEGLTGVARYFNTLAKYGVPADHRKIAVVLHGDATEIIQTSAAFKSRNNGRDNPNVALIKSLKNAGVDFRVCGQAVLAKKIDPKNILPEIELDLWALTTLTNLQLRGYVHVGN